MHGSRSFAMLVGVALAGRAAALGAQQGRPPDDRLTVGQVVDSAALVAALRVTAAPVGKTPFVYEVRYDSAGGRESIESIYAIPVAYDSAMVRLLTEQVSVLLTPARGGIIALRVEPGPNARVTRYDEEIDEFPRPRNVWALGLGAERIYNAHRTELPADGARLKVKMRVNPDGTTAQATLLNPTGIAAVDAEVLALAQRQPFSPAMIRHRGVRSWVTMEIRLRRAQPSL